MDVSHIPADIALQQVVQDPEVHEMLAAYCQVFYGLVYTNQIVFDYGTGELDEVAAVAIGVAGEEGKKLLGKYYREDGKYAEAIHAMVLSKLTAEMFTRS